MSTVKFNNKDAIFFPELKQRINQYFEQNKIPIQSRRGDASTGIGSIAANVGNAIESRHFACRACPIGE